MPLRVVRRAEEAIALARAKPATTPPVITREPPATSQIASELWIGVDLPGRQGGTRLGVSRAGVPVSEIGAGALERLAARAQRFTPRVSLSPPDGLLLEVKGSLHLFGGIPGLFRALAGECSTAGLRSVLALAPTPLAALVAARAGKPVAVTDRAQLVGQLAPLPLTLLRWPEEIFARLARMGVRTIGQALRLPRAGFASRFGPGPLAELDRLIGRRADLRHRFQARERFRSRRDLDCESESHADLLAILASLLEDLERFLRARQRAILELQCLLRHRQAPPTRCLLRLAAPAAHARQLTELLDERLSAVRLPEPVRSCELRSGPLVHQVLARGALWQPGEQGGGGGAESPELIERLRARLGSEAVYGLQILSGHRPENAWSATEPAGARPGGSADPFPWGAFRRPIWLLPAPQQLKESAGLPRRRGPLRLLNDAERIETGWWDGGGIGRDYYKAVDIYGVLLWVFRERAVPNRWFLHGVFG